MTTKYERQAYTGSALLRRTRPTHQITHESNTSTTQLNYGSSGARWLNKSFRKATQSQHGFLFSRRNSCSLKVENTAETRGDFASRGRLPPSITPVADLEGASRLRLRPPLWAMG